MFSQFNPHGCGLLAKRDKKYVRGGVLCQFSVVPEGCEAHVFKFPCGMQSTWGKIKRQRRAKWQVVHLGAIFNHGNYHQPPQ